MKTSRLLGLMGLMLVVLAVSTSVSYGFHGKRGVPSAMYYADTESWTPYSQDGLNPYAGYEAGTQMIHPFNMQTPWAYRSWNRKLISPTPEASYEFGGQSYGYNPFGSYGTPYYGNRGGNGLGARGAYGAGVHGGHGVPGGYGGYGVGAGANAPCENCPTESQAAPSSYEVEQPATSTYEEVAPAVEGEPMTYAKSEGEMAYGQEYQPEFVEGDSFYGGDFGDCCDPCGDICYDPCFDFCDDVVVAKRPFGLFKNCKLFGNTKSWFSKLSMKKSFCSRNMLNDPWFADDCCFGCDPCCDPCGISCCDMCCDPCCGGMADFGGGSSCCGQSDGDTMMMDSGDATFDSSAAPAPGPAPAAPANGGIEATTPDNSGQISVPAYPAAPAVPTAPAPAANPASGVINMTVPEDAVVYVNGYKTRLTGTERSFTANNLVEGQSYEFEICVVSSVNGEVVKQVKNTVLTSGSFSTLAFNQEESPFGTVALK